jgi:peptidoglycan/LPS O-acetylase OafA/YrhL
MFFILSLMVFVFVTGRPISWNEIFAALVFMNNYFPGELGNAVMPFGHIWSLSVEEHCYILLSLVAIASRKKWLCAKWTIAGLTVLFSAIGFWNFSHYSGRELYGKDLHSEVMAFGIFASASFLLFLHKVKLPKLPTILFVFLVSIGILMHWWSIPAPLSRTVGVGFLALAVNLLFVAPDVVKQALSIKPLKMMGLWSFSIYLWQQPFYLAVHRTGMSELLAVSSAICCGVASFYLLEQPLRLYLNSVWGKSAEIPVATAK